MPEAVMTRRIDGAKRRNPLRDDLLSNAEKDSNENV
jgi:hypothetical protein